MLGSEENMWRMSAEAEWDVGRKGGAGGRQKTRLSNTLTLISNLPCSPPLLVSDRPSDRREWAQMRDANVNTHTHTHASYTQTQREQFLTF